MRKREAQHTATQSPNPGNQEKERRNHSHRESEHKRKEVGTNAKAMLSILTILSSLVLQVHSADTRHSTTMSLLLEEHAEMFASIRGACKANTKWPPSDAKTDKTDQVPMPAMCGYCQNAVYSVANDGDAGIGCSTATDAGMEACQILAKEIKGKRKDIIKFYKDRVEELGPGGGWSLEFCLTMDCCKS